MIDFCSKMPKEKETKREFLSRVVKEYPGVSVCRADQSVLFCTNPVITRWAAWLRAAVFYCDNFDSVKAVVDSFDRKSAISIAESQKMFADSRIKTDLAYIKANFASLVQATVSLQGRGLELKYGIDTIVKIEENLGMLDSEKYADKMERILSRNKGFKSLVNIKNVLYSNDASDDKYLKNLNPTEIAMFKYCPVTSAEVERSFSAYGDILTEKRRSFSFENIKQHMIVQCNTVKASE